VSWCIVAKRISVTSAGTPPHSAMWCAQNLAPAAAGFSSSDIAHRVASATVVAPTVGVRREGRSSRDRRRRV
jgi:hypothetical protein